MKSQAYFEKIHKQIEFRLNNSNSNIKLAVAWLTDNKLFDILCKKALSGLKVELIIAYQDINLESGIDYKKLNNAGGKVYWIGNGYKYEALMHNKFCIIDDYTLITGSYNWTQKAKSNHESITVIEGDSNLILDFTQEFERILKKHNKVTENQIETDWLKVSIRLQTLLNLIKLEDEEDIEYHIKKIKTLINITSNDTNEKIIQNIILNCEKKQFQKSVLEIEDFLRKFNQVTTYQDPEISALKLELKVLENQINAFDNEKIELEKILSDFQYRHSIELGQIILEVLSCMKTLYINDKEKRKEVENDYKHYSEQFEIEKSKKHFELTEDEKRELKKNFRKATMLCHPDKVSEEHKQIAETIFIELKKAQEENDLATVNRILNDLENGFDFNLQTDKVSEKNKLILIIENLRAKLNTLETEIQQIKESDSYKKVIKISDWDKYFEDTRNKLQEQLQNLKKKLSEKLKNGQQ